MNVRGTQHGSSRKTPAPAPRASCTSARLALAARGEAAEVMVTVNSRSAKRDGARGPYCGTSACGKVDLRLRSAFHFPIQGRRGFQPKARYKVVRLRSRARDAVAHCE